MMEYHAMLTQLDILAAQESKRGLDRQEGTLLKGDAYRLGEGLKTIAGGAVSFVPPPTPKPSTTSRTDRGGGANLHMVRWVRKPGEDIGRPIAGGLVAFRRTDNGGRTMWGPDAAGCRLNTQKRAERRQIG